MPHGATSHCAAYLLLPCRCAVPKRGGRLDIGTGSGSALGPTVSPGRSLCSASRRTDASRGEQRARPHHLEVPVNSADGWGDDVYQPDGSEIQEDSGLLDVEDTLVDDGVDDPLDRGWSPPDRPWAVERSDVTAAERQHGETLDQRLAEELPDLVTPDTDGIGD